jgi:hypothetical protein
MSIRNSKIRRALRLTSGSGAAFEFGMIAPLV